MPLVWVGARYNGTWRTFCEDPSHVWMTTSFDKESVEYRRERHIAQTGHECTDVEWWT